MLFRVSSIRFEFEAARDFRPPPGGETNLFRGAMGAALHASPDVYARWFSPRWPEGPSGFRDAPRPFLLRWAGPQGSGDHVFAVDLILFENSPPLSVIEPALEAAIARRTGARQIKIERGPALDLPVYSSACADSDHVRLCFVTPTELKSGNRILHEPEFSVLIERLAERVWALGRLYQGWQADFDIRSFVETAKHVRMTSWEWTRTDLNRRSARSGTLHSIGGYTGWAEFSGPLGRFLPLLEIGAWCGVGRHTVWGKGQLIAHPHC